jgi:[lysine-biosynthesis-protein LysW]--L-2-aminoadipate ligase
MKVGVLCSRVRIEEKHIFEALRKRGVEFEKVDARHLTFDLSDGRALDYDIVLVRCLSYSRALYAARILQMQGVKAVNAYEVIATCGDKVLTTLAFLEHGIPTPRTVVALSEESALAAIEGIGYPVVLKPSIGSWGRLLAKIGDRHAAEAVVEYKTALDKPQDQPFYIQEYVDKPGRDIRTLVVGDETVYAIYRSSSHWITNTARGGSVASAPITPDIDRLSRAAAGVAGGGIVAVDLLETRDGDLLVNEINHTPEFHGAMEVVEIDVAGRMVDYVLDVARGGSW